MTTIGAGRPARMRAAGIPGRRAVLLSALAPLGCRSAPPPALPLAPIAYRHLTPLALNVATVVIAPADPVGQGLPTRPGEGGASPPSNAGPGPAEAVRIMGRDRLAAVGTEGEARFTVTQASLTRAAGLVCQVGCRLEILGPAGARLGFIEATARAVATGAEAGRADAPQRLLRRAMDDLNVEFEFQLRRSLRAWLIAVPPGGTGAVPAPPAGTIGREELPRG